MSNDNLNSPFRGLEGLLESLKTDVIHSLQANGKYATGQTAQQITITSDGNGVQLNLPAYIQALETGRRPTGTNATPDNPPMIERIKQWCQAKGIPYKAAWAIKKSIDKHGFTGTPGILSEPLGIENINLRLKPVSEEIAQTITQQIAGAIDPLGI